MPPAPTTRTARLPAVAAPAALAVAPPLVDAVRDRLTDAAHPPTPADVARALAQVAGPLPAADQEAAQLAVTAELLGAGPLEALLADPGVTDVLVNGPARVWVDRGAGLERTEVRFADEEAVRRLATRLAAAAGRRLDTAAPFADARLPDGSRLHAVLAPVATDGTCLSLRRPRRVPLTLTECVYGQDAALPGVLRALVAGRLAVVVTGGTGTGKTTLLAALLGCVHPAERVVVVEDTSELVLTRENVVRLQGRPANIEGAGAITQRDLVRQALRMRPDRLVVGEVRGPEVLDLLVAFNTGHDGGLTTIHANTAGALPARVEALGALAGLSRAAVHSQLAAALQVAIHLRRDSGGRRGVAAIGVLRTESDGLVRVRPALVTAPAGNAATGGGPGGPPGALLPADGLSALRDLLRDRGVTLPPPFGAAL
ncbi:TadA family conjugal transfer-associated ATPase [Frankia sp. AgB1.9]|uniref:TadA family conjugal transfer-associated ATPase n=1 Tax=unclassified Frankia TaxID=2632575 RepID=UPI001934B1CD|nr:MULTISPECIES: TadA family conjugal transfer-associated ATPase [unclassified Frankia]MBL7493879.1 TadA family conjugal transfer-associated ATPase [Frankia sp. AgW1.1]MBL7552322.1 TadA family conjugal transfer-associated ATPase [Frankia sp. AgB1.9]MBL7622075.1 TadA family conjugal transfer-associated ATPase [Frankia sp. AgB1.8]